MSSGKGDPIGSLNIFTAKDPNWTYVRKRLTVVFTASKLRTMQDLLIKKSDDLIERLTKEIGKGDLIQTRQICTDYTSDVVGESAFGISSESTRDGDSVVRRITREFGAFNLHRGLSWSSIFFFPELFFLAVMRQYRHQWLLIVTILQNLLEMSEDLLVAQAAVFLFGGFDTSGSVFTFTIYELAHNHDAQERLYKELEETKKQLGDKDFDLKSLEELPYLNAVIKETLRKYPPMGWLDRVATKEYQIDNNLTIPAGSVIYVNTVGMHMDPEYFPEPEVYNPNRFLPGNDKSILPYTFMPFGDGPRSCIGLRFAKQVLRFGIAKVCLNFKMEPIPKTPKPHEVQIDKYGLLMMPGEKLSVNLIPRPPLSA
ncbi:hypothetical protein K1T71_009494 [Dendrolimus kikuchii]|uniref:Uncharacterized protein n=1 Tax=Dendrolimus kikuchii TaxID=765133 RepID=A0ACC1CUP0_9NEOP|nr:hypothetical protein K1T71_009494 [Dendrolimus kikuchii]